MNLKTPVSGRQFAKMVGQAEASVRKAKNRGSIIKGITSDGKFIPEIAANEWGKTILPEFGGLEVKKIPAVKKPLPVRKPKKEAQTAEEVIAELMDDPLPDLSDNEIDEDVDGDLDDKIQKPEAERVTAILKAKILQLALKEKQGKLVPIDKVNNVLFGYGQEIRNTLEALPAQVIDRVRACDNRYESLRVLTDSIFDALNIISDINSRDI